MTTAALLLATACATAGPPAGNTELAGARTIYLSGCVISFIDDVQVPARKAGVLKSIAVKEGDSVSTGDFLAQIDDEEAQVAKSGAELEVQIADAQAESSASVDAAAATVGVAQAEYEQSKEINEKSPRTISEFELRRLNLTFERAGYQTQVAELERDVAKLTRGVRAAQLQAAENELKNRRIESPLGGVVDVKLRHVGEWVSAGDPVLRIVRMDKLRVEGFLAAADVGPEEALGAKVTVTVPLARGHQATFDGRIDYFSYRVEANGTYRVRAELTNRQEAGKWVLKDGMLAEMAIDLGDVVPVKQP